MEKKKPASILGKRSRSSSPSPPLRSEKKMKAAGALYGGYVARGGYRVGGTRLDFESFVDALPKEFWSDIAVTQKTIEKAVLAVQGDKKRERVERVDANYPANAKTILALEFLAVLEPECKWNSTHIGLVILNILNSVRADLIRRTIGLDGVLGSCLNEAKQDVAQAQALLVRLEEHGSPKDKRQADELVKDLKTRKDTIEEGMKLLEMIK